MTIQGVDDAELANLTDAEREALEEGDKQEAEDKKDLTSIAEGGEGAGDDEGKGDEEDDGDDTGEDEETAEAKAAREKEEAAAVAAAAKREAELKEMSAEDRAKAEADDKAAKEAAAKAAEGKAKQEEEAKAAKAGEDADADETEILRPRLPRYEVKPVEKYDEQVKALDEQYAATLAKFQAGDIELPALLAEQRSIDAKRLDLRDQRTRAEMATEFNDKAAKTEWLNDVQDFFVHIKQTEGIDYKKPLLNVAIDSVVKNLANDKNNADWSPQKFLREAHKVVKAELGLAGAAPKKDEKPGEKGGKKEDKPAGRKPELAIVKDVGKLPSAGDDDASGGNPEFAALDKLDGIEYEDALAAMPQKKQDAYLRQKAG